MGTTSLIKLIPFNIPRRADNEDSGDYDIDHDAAKNAPAGAKHKSRLRKQFVETDKGALYHKFDLLVHQ